MSNVMSGKIYDLQIINDKVAQIVLLKKDRDKFVPVAISIYGYWKDKAFNEHKVGMKDKIRGTLYYRSKMVNGRYYTDIFFREIVVLQKAAPKMGLQGIMFDKETGEIFE